MLPGDSYQQSVRQTTGLPPTGAGQLQNNLNYHTGLVAQRGSAQREIDNDLFERRLRMRRWLESMHWDEARERGKYGALGALLGTGAILPFALAGGGGGDTLSPGQSMSQMMALAPMGPQATHLPVMMTPSGPGQMSRMMGSR